MGSCESSPYSRASLHVVLIFQVAVTLYDWRTFPETFAKSRDPDEKALYALLTEAVGPTVISALVVSPDFFWPSRNRKLTSFRPRSKNVLSKKRSITENDHPESQQKNWLRKRYFDVKSPNVKWKKGWINPDQKKKPNSRQKLP